MLVVPRIRSLEKTANKRSWHLGPDEQDYSSGSEDAPWVNVTKEVLAQAHESLPPLSATDKELADCMEGLVLETKGVHLRAGQAVDQPSGSFQAEPVEEWYRGPIKKLEEMTRSGGHLTDVHGVCKDCAFFYMLFLCMVKIRLLVVDNTGWCACSLLHAQSCVLPVIQHVMHSATSNL